MDVVDLALDGYCDFWLICDALQDTKSITPLPSFVLANWKLDHWISRIHGAYTSNLNPCSRHRVQLLRDAAKFFERTVRMESTKTGTGEKLLEQR